MVLRWIENLQKCRRRIATEVPAHLVDLVQHQYGVIHVGAPHGLNDPPRKGSDIGPAMASQFRFIMHAAQAEPFERATHGSGDGLPKTGFADARRSEDRKSVV